MSTSMNRVQVGPDAYANVSNGNLNLSVFLPNGVNMKIIVAGSEPALDEPVFFPHKSGMNSSNFSVNNLEAEDDVWIWSEKPMELLVMRGPAILTFR